MPRIVELELCNCKIYPPKKSESFLRLVHYINRFSRIDSDRYFTTVTPWQTAITLPLLVSIKLSFKWGKKKDLTASLPSIAMNLKTRRSLVDTYFPKAELSTDLKFSQHLLYLSVFFVTFKCLYFCGCEW